ncbi:MAG: 4'-phosphopantetheinyl transferase superfamily protein [Ignavibacteriaceae bacterium]
MIGNDVVDLAAAAKESNWQRKGFLKKIFTEKEQFFIASSDDPNLTVWLLWSMKESAYKIFVQQSSKRFYSPLKFECTQINNSSEVFNAQVFYENIKYEITSKVLNEGIFTTAFLNTNEAEQLIFHENLEINYKSFRDRRKKINSALLNNVAEKINKPAANLVIKKDKFDIPYLFENESRLDASVSISHHGRYAAYAVELNYYFPFVETHCHASLQQVVF